MALPQVWRTSAASGGVSNLLVADIDTDGVMEVVTFGSGSGGGRIHVIDGLTGVVESVFREKKSEKSSQVNNIQWSC
jgi:hypothetical protein